MRFMVWGLLWVLRRTIVADCGSQTGTPQPAGSPAQQFSVRKPINSFMPS